MGKSENARKGAPNGGGREDFGSDRVLVLNGSIETRWTIWNVAIVISVRERSAAAESFKMLAGDRQHLAIRIDTRWSDGGRDGRLIEREDRENGEK